jgi:hypothetical protein
MALPFFCPCPGPVGTVNDRANIAVNPVPIESEDSITLFHPAGFLSAGHKPAIKSLDGISSII